MGHPERHPATHQPLGDIGGQGVADRRQRGHPVNVEDQSGHQTRHRRQHHLQLGHRVEDRFLVLLQIAVVGQRHRFEGGQQTGQVADQPAGFTAGQLGDIRVLLLRHDRAAGRPGIVQGDVTEFGCAPQNDVLGQPGYVDGDHGQNEGSLGGEVPR